MPGQSKHDTPVHCGCFGPRFCSFQVGMWMCRRDNLGTPPGASSAAGGSSGHLQQQCAVATVSAPDALGSVVRPPSTLEHTEVFRRGDLGAPPCRLPKRPRAAKARPPTPPGSDSLGDGCVPRLQAGRPDSRLYLSSGPFALTLEPAASEATSLCREKLSSIAGACVQAA